MAKQRVLILCTGNSSRSQMAEGLLREIAGDRFEVFSAGTRPAGLSPNAVTAMAEIGIDISRHRSKSVDEFDRQRFDYVITVCDNAKESCPIFAETGKRVHHSFEDPAAAPADRKLPQFRKVRDEMSGWLREFARDAPI
jgi:arsenate reductase